MSRLAVVNLSRRSPLTALEQLTSLTSIQDGNVKKGKRSLTIVANNITPTEMPPPGAAESLPDLARRLATKGPVKTMSTPRRVRFLFNGAMVADTLGTSGALYVWEHEYYPQFYLPMEAFVQPNGFTVALTPGDSIEDDTGKTIVGGELKLSVKQADKPDTDFKTLSEMILFAADLQGPGKPLRNMVKVTFSAVDQWFEEDTPIKVHPKDPFKRIDILHSMRPIKFSLNNTLLAESTTSHHLYETSLPCRYYILLTSCDTSLLRRSTTTSQCPYKGEAEYYDVVLKDGSVFRDLLWVYARPTMECAAIAGMCCFWNEKVDVDVMENGKWRRQERPRTHFG